MVEESTSSLEMTVSAVKTIGMSALAVPVGAINGAIKGAAGSLANLTAIRLNYGDISDNIKKGLVRDSTVPTHFKVSSVVEYCVRLPTRIVAHSHMLYRVADEITQNGMPETLEYTNLPTIMLATNLISVGWEVHRLYQNKKESTKEQ